MGLDCMEDEATMNCEIRFLMNDLNRENTARLNLINLVRVGNHVQKKKKRVIDQ